MKYVKPLKLFHNVLERKVSERGLLLGLDMGDKYIGVAVSDSKYEIASPVRYEFA